MSRWHRRKRRFAVFAGVGAAAATLVAVAFAHTDAASRGAASASRTDRWSSSTVDIAHALARERDGKLVAAGLSARFGHYEVALARYGVDGRLDRRFGTGGKVLTDRGLRYPEMRTAVITQLQGSARAL